MTPYSFNYLRVSSVEEAISQLQQHGDDAKLLAGGHSLIPAMKLRLSAPTALIDLQGIDALKAISDEGNAIRIGALATHNAVATSDLLQANCSVVSEMAAGIGDTQVRNKGTIGGSLAHADPAADYPALMLALGADIHIQGPTGSRTVSADDFFTGMFETALGEAELITAVSVPKMGSGLRASYAKFANPASRYAIVGVAAVVQVDAQGTCTAARIGITGAADHAFRAIAMEQAITGVSLNKATISEASSHTPDESTLLSDLSGSAAYRAHLCSVMAKRALTAASS